MYVVREGAGQALVATALLFAVAGLMGTIAPFKSTLVADCARVVAQPAGLATSQTIHLLTW